MISTLLFALATAALWSPAVTDTDGDGLTDAVELYLSSSTEPQNHGLLDDADTDGDGVPDGFELCLTNHIADASTPIVADCLRVVAHRAPGESFLRVYVLAIGDTSSWDEWFVTTAVLNELGQPEQEIITSAMDLKFTVTHGAKTMKVLGTTVRRATLRGKPLAFAAVGRVTAGGTRIGDSVTFVYDPGQDFMGMWRGDSLIQIGMATDTILQPMDPLLTPVDLGGVSLPKEVCGATASSVPSAVPGILLSVVTASGCTGGEWACPAGVCTAGSSPSLEDKPIIDVMLVAGSTA